MKTQIYTDLNKDMILEWKRLWDRSSFAHYFNSYEWFDSCRALFNSNKKAIIFIYEKTSLVAVLPLIEQKRYGLSVYCNPGGLYADKSSLLMLKKSKKVTRRLVKASKKIGNVCISEVPEDFSNVIASLGYKKSPLYSETSRFSLDGNSFRFMSKEKRKKLFRLINKYGDKIEHKRILGSDIKNYLSAIEAIDSKSRKKMAGKEMLSDGLQYELIKNCINTNPNNLRLDLLYYNRSPIVYEFGMMAKNIDLAYQTAFDENFKKIEPGRTILYYIYEAMAKSNLEIYDWGRGYSSLKKEFTPFYTRQSTFYLGNVTSVAWFYSLDFIKKIILNNQTLYKLYLSFIKKVFS